jgi:hypothetical protein
MPSWCQLHSQHLLDAPGSTGPPWIPRREVSSVPKPLTRPHVVAETPGAVRPLLPLEAGRVGPAYVPHTGSNL